MLPIIHVEATWLCNTQLNISEYLVQVLTKTVYANVSVYIVRIMRLSTKKRYTVIDLGI